MALASCKLYSHREASVDTHVDVQPIRVKIRLNYVFIIMFVWLDPISECLVIKYAIIFYISLIDIVVNSKAIFFVFIVISLLKR